VNIIVQRTNPYYEQHLRICAEKKVPFYITSLGNPKGVIEEAKKYGARVFCDVTNLEHAQKCADLGCDGFIAVGQGAGGHAGPFPLQVLVPALIKYFPGKVVIAAGGIATGEGILSALALGADGVSIGTRFIASTEAGVNTAYKEAIVGSGMSDIVMTEKLSGTPCTIINTPGAQRMGLKQNWFERWLSRNPRTKKWFKGLVQLRGFKRLEQSIVPNHYQTLWCAGQSVQLIDEVLPCAEIIDRLKAETMHAAQDLSKTFPVE
jgi:nitronate monooxygenase